jgi:uncharacterized protein (DUF1697 family)
LPRYAAFLRAVNVGGRTIRMERLREIFTKAGFADVETFIASGNVVFESRSSSIPALEAKIEAALQKALGYEVATFVRRADALEAIARHQPFPVDAAGSPGGTVYVCFLRAAPDASYRRQLLSFRTDVDDFDVKGQEAYWLVRGKLLDSKADGPAFGRALGLTTMRNRNTIVRLAAKLSKLT